MRAMAVVGMILAAIAAAGCGGPDEPQKKEKDEVMRVEDTAFGPLVGTPKKVEDRVNASQHQYRDSLEGRLGEDEGGGPKDEEPPGD